MSAAKSREYRKELREISNYPRCYVKVKALNDYEYNGGLIVDSSSSGLGIVTSLSVPLGAKIAISLDDEYSAIGEVVSIEDEWGEWEWSGMVRMGVRLIDKTNWPM
jgi:hypothetical protein